MLAGESRRPAPGWRPRRFQARCPVLLWGASLFPPPVTCAELGPGLSPACSRCSSRSRSAANRVRGVLSPFDSSQANVACCSTTGTDRAGGRVGGVRVKIWPLSVPSLSRAAQPRPLAGSQSVLPLPGELNGGAAVPAIHPSLDRDEPEPARSVLAELDESRARQGDRLLIQSSISDLRHVPTMRISSPASSPLLPTPVGAPGLLGRSAPQRFRPRGHATQTAVARGPHYITAA